jgi:hypothetical protein
MLVVATNDLQAAVQCPRCATIHVVGALIPAATPVAAVRVVMHPGGAYAPGSLPQLPPMGAPSPSHGFSPPPPGAAMNPLVAWTPTPGPVAAAPAGGQYVAFPVPAAVRQAGRIGRFGSWLLSTADAIDRTLYGARVLAIAGAAFVTVLASALEAWLPRGLVAKDWPQPDAPIVTAVSTFLFTGLLMTLFIARLGSFRDDDGQWSVELIQRRAHELRVDVADAFSAFGTMESALRWKAFGRVTLFVGFLVLALRNIWVLATITLDEFVSVRLAELEAASHGAMLFGIGAATIGLLAWLTGWSKLRNQPITRSLHPTEQERAQIVTAVGALPSTIDCNDAENVQRLARHAGHPVLIELLQLLATWKPRQSNYEDQYEASLDRLIRRRMPGSNPQCQRPIGSRSEGTAGRADIIVADSVLIEMKRGVNTSTAQKALGQIQMYMRGWSRGPVILLLCDATSENAERLLRREIEQLRAQGSSVVMVLAARSGRAAR